MRPVSRYVPPLAVMALIFALSAQPGLNSGLSFDFVLRKLAHMTIFATLWLTLMRASDWRRPLAAAVATVLYAVSDELHQSFVSDRHASPVDVAIDAAGIGLAALAWVRTARLTGSPGPPWPWRGARRATASRAR